MTLPKSVMSVTILLGLLYQLDTDHSVKWVEVIETTQVECKEAEEKNKTIRFAKRLANAWACILKEEVRFIRTVNLHMLKCWHFQNRCSLPGRSPTSVV